MYPEQLLDTDISLGALRGGVLMILCGIVPLCILLGRKRRQSKACTVKLTAVCIRVEPLRHVRHSTRSIYCPIWEYTYDGITYTRRNPTSGGKYRNYTGRSAVVYIDPRNPHAAYFPDDIGIRIFIIVLAALALFGVGLLISAFAPM